MLRQFWLPLALLGLLVQLAGCEKDPLSTKGQIHLSGDKEKAGAKPVEQPIREIGWDDLIPEEWRPDPKLVDMYNNGEIDDDDPRMIALKKKVTLLKEKAPINNSLDGKKIKIPGFVVPVEMDDKIVREFLLVPYHGACVHVPPPPANQTIDVKTNQQSAGAYNYFDTVWVTGEIKVINTKGKVAESGYTIFATKIEPYE